MEPGNHFELLNVFWISYTENEKQASMATTVSVRIMDLWTDMTPRRVFRPPEVLM